MKHASQARASEAVASTATLFAGMESPLRTVLQGAMRDLDGFKDLISHYLQPGPGTFRGYDGIDTRGDIADLLASDWALYDIDRTEFLRRVAMREALFRHKVHESDSQGKAICLVVDSGAWMLGHNRLLGLGAVFWLAALAERHGVDFLWCDSARPKVWNEGLSRRDIRAYLGRVAQHEMDAALIETALSALPPKRAAPEDLWLVGPDQLRPHLDLSEIKAAFLVALPRAPEPGAQAETDIALWARGHLRRMVPLRFPEDGLCVGALRRPFKPESLVPATANAGASLASDALTSTWAPQHWNEFPDESLAVRWPEGVLLTGALDNPGKQAMWFPLPEDAHVLAVHVDMGPSFSSRSFRMLWITGWPDAPHIHLAAVPMNDAEKPPTADASIALQGDLPALDFGHAAIPSQPIHLKAGNGRVHALHDRDGKAFQIGMTSGVVRPKPQQARLLMQDGGSQIFAVSEMDPRLAGARIASEGKGAFRDFYIAVSNPEHFAAMARDVRAATSDLAVLLSHGERQYSVIHREITAPIPWSGEARLVQVLGPSKGFAYQPSDGTVLQYRVGSEGKINLHPRSDKGAYPGLTHLRSAFRQRAVFGVELKDGKPANLVRIRLGGRGPAFKVMDVAEKIAAARTIWLQS
ncbi:MAG: hypothetical protein AAF626_11700 [Pseudomonadota bacterium]